MITLFRISRNKIGELHPRNDAYLFSVPLVTPYAHLGAQETHKSGRDRHSNKPSSTYSDQRAPSKYLRRFFDSRMVLQSSTNSEQVGREEGGGRLRASRLDRSSKNEKVMVHENSRARLQRRDTSRGKWLIVIMNKHYRGNCDIPATILAVTTSLTPTSPLSSSFLIPHLKCIESS